MKETENLINNRINTKRIRIIGDSSTGEISKDLALSIAKSENKDLILLNVTKDDVGICKIEDYQKYLYDKKKKDKEQKKKQKLNQSEVKEIRMTPNIDEHDFNFKLNHAKNFLTNNDKVLVSVFFKGREITYKDQGQIVLLNFAKELEAIGVPEYLPKMEGKKMLMMIKPKAKK